MRRKNTTKQMMKVYISESLLLLMDKKSYEDISIAEIADKAGVNRSTYYRNFSSKQEIVQFYFEQIMNGYLMEYEVLTDKTLKNYLCVMFKHFYQYKAQLLAIHRNNLSHLILEVLNHFFENRPTLKQWNEKDQFRHFYHIGGIFNFFILWFSHGMKETPDELTKIAVAMFPTNAKPMLFE